MFVTHSDSGHWVLDSSALAGTAVGAAASNLYYPKQDRGFSNSVSRAGLDLGNTALFNVDAAKTHKAVYRLAGFNAVQATFGMTGPLPSTGLMFAVCMRACSATHHHLSGYISSQSGIAFANSEAGSRNSLLRDCWPVFTSTTEKLP